MTLLGGSVMSEERFRLLVSMVQRAWANKLRCRLQAGGSGPLDLMSGSHVGEWNSCRRGYLGYFLVRMASSSLMVSISAAGTSRAAATLSIILAKSLLEVAFP